MRLRTIIYFREDGWGRLKSALKCADSARPEPLELSRAPTHLRLGLTLTLRRRLLLADAIALQQRLAACRQ